MESAVQTTPPIRSVASMPERPVSPREERRTAEMMSVVSVIPEMGVTEIIATAQAETEEKRKETTRVIRSESRARIVA